MTWRIMGSNGLVDWNPGLVIESYTRGAPDDFRKGWGVKTLFRPFPDFRFGIHRPTVKGAGRDPARRAQLSMLRWVNGSGVQMTRQFLEGMWRSSAATLGYDHAEIAHFAVKSREAFLLRQLRGNVNMKPDKYDATYFGIFDRNETEQTGLLRHLPAVRERIAEYLRDPDPVEPSSRRARVARAADRGVQGRGAPPAADGEARPPGGRTLRGARCASLHPAAGAEGQVHRRHAPPGRDDAGRHRAPCGGVGRENWRPSVTRGISRNWQHSGSHRRVEPRQLLFARNRDRAPEGSAPRPRSMRAPPRGRPRHGSGSRSCRPDASRAPRWRSACRHRSNFFSRCARRALSICSAGWGRSAQRVVRDLLLRVVLRGARRRVGFSRRGGRHDRLLDIGPAANSGRPHGHGSASASKGRGRLEPAFRSDGPRRISRHIGSCSFASFALNLCDKPPRSSGARSAGARGRRPSTGGQARVRPPGARPSWATAICACAARPRGNRRRCAGPRWETPRR